MNIVLKHFIDLSGRIVIIPVGILDQEEEISGEFILIWNGEGGGNSELWNYEIDKLERYNFTETGGVYAEADVLW